MTLVMDLRPGDVVELDGAPATFIAWAQHRRFVGLSLVVWRLADGSVCPDALSPRADVGPVVKSTPAQRHERLIEAVGGPIGERS